MLSKLANIWTKDKALLTVWFLVSSLISGNWLLSWLELFFQVAPTPTEAKLYKLTLTLLLISIGLFASLILQYKKIKEKPDFSAYQHSPKKECWINPNNSNDRICSVCKTKNIMTPLDYPGTYWQCPIHKIVTDPTGPSVTTEPDPYI